MLPIQGRLGGHTHRSNSEVWHFDKLESETTVPRLANVQVAIKSDQVVAQINRSRFDFRKRLYMVTGVRIARGARLDQKVSNDVGGEAKVGVDLTALAAVPVTVGPTVDASIKKSNHFSFKGSSDFVYAYRICEINYGKDVYVKPYNKGETQGANEDDEDERDEEVEGQEERILVEKVATTDYDGSGIPHQLFKLDSSSTEDDGEAFILSH